MKFITLLLLSSLLFSKELFTTNTILKHLTTKNPYVYDALAKKYIYQEKINYVLGAFDTKINAQYDTKAYPASKGDFLKLSLGQRLENGLDMEFGYREATGVQEYNNIKTGKEGELLLGVNLPLFSLLKNINTHKFNLHEAFINAKKFDFDAKNNLRLFYFTILSTYHQVLYAKATLKLEKALLFKAKKRKKDIAKKVNLGRLPRLSLIEANQHLINRKQNFLSAQNNYINQKSILFQYLNISQKKFFKTYQLPNLFHISKHTPIQLDRCIAFALENRFDLKVLEYEKKRLNLEKKYTTLLKYPKFNVGLYGVHDFKYGNGFKIALNFELPLQRRKYKGKSFMLDKRIQDIKNQKDRRILEIKTNLTTIVGSLNTLFENIKNAKKEVKLVKKLEKVEKRKYRLGRSTLFMVNQREMMTLDTQKKLLKYNLTYLLLQQASQKEMGKAFEI